MGYQTEYIIENGIEYEVRTYAAGSRIWYLNRSGTVRHRVRGPAVEWGNGDTEWWLNGTPHREDGPSVEYTDKGPVWYWHGIYLTTEVREQGIDQLSPEEIKFWLPILAAQKSK